MGKALSGFLQAIKKNKFNIVISMVAFLVFTFLIFPYGDLSDLVTEQVAKVSQNQVFVSFKDLGINLVPPGVKMTQVIVDSSFAPRLKAASLALAPSISGLLTFKPGFVANFTGLFGGDLNLTVKTGDKISEDVRGQNIKLYFSDIKLKELTNFANLPLDINGSGKISFEGDIDPSFSTQPSSDYNIELNAVEIPAGSVPTPIGPLNLPTIKVNGLKVQGRLVNGELIIEDSTLGQAGDFISGRIKGRMDLKITGGAGHLVPVPGRYELKLDLTLNRDAESQIGVFLSLFDKYKTLTGTGARYAMELSGTPGGLPQAKALTGF